MSEFSYIAFNIDLAKIPEDATTEFTRKNGDIGCNVNLKISKMRSPDQWGNTHAVTLNPKYTPGEPKPPTVYVGNGKEYTFKSPNNHSNNQSDDEGEPF